MPTNIAEVINQGTNRQVAQTAQLGQQMEQIGEQQVNNSLQQIALQNQVQQQVDMRANAIMKVVDHKEQRVAAARKKAQALVGQMSARPAGEEFLPGKLDNDLEVAEAELKAARDDRNKFILSMANTPQVMAALKNASFMDQETAQKVFSEDFQTSLAPYEQDAFVKIMTAIQRSEAEMTQATLQAEEDRKLAGIEERAYRAEQGKLRAQGYQSTPEEPPAGTHLSKGKYYSRLPFSDDLKEADAEEWYARDISKYQYLTDAMEDLPAEFRSEITEAFSNWTPDLSKPWTEQKSFAESFSEAVLAKDWDTASSGLPAEIVEDLREVAESKDPRRIGAFVESMKQFVLPPKPPRLTPPQLEAN